MLCPPGRAVRLSAHGAGGAPGAAERGTDAGLAPGAGHRVGAGPPLVGAGLLPEPAPSAPGPSCPPGLPSRGGAQVSPGGVLRFLSPEPGSPRPQPPPSRTQCLRWRQRRRGQRGECFGSPWGPLRLSWAPALEGSTADVPPEPPPKPSYQAANHPVSALFPCPSPQSVLETAPPRGGPSLTSYSSTLPATKCHRSHQSQASEMCRRRGTSAGHFHNGHRHRGATGPQGSFPTRLRMDCPLRGVTCGPEEPGS